MTEYEFRESYLGFINENKKTSKNSRYKKFFKSLKKEIKESIDWRFKMSPI